MSVPVDIKLEFKDGTTWKPAYQRNNKSKGQKNLRCFPNCSLGFGHQEGFCGQSIVISLQYNGGSLDAEDLVAAGEFAVADSSPQPVGSLTTLGSINNHGTAEDEKMTYIEGARVEASPKDMRGRTKAINFEFNRSLKGWHYGFLGSKKTRDLFHVFRAYVLQKIHGQTSKTGEDLYRVVASVDSPSWQMYCRRRKKFTEAIRQVKMQALERSVQKKLQQQQNQQHQRMHHHHQHPHTSMLGVPTGAFDPSRAQRGGMPIFTKTEYGKLGVDTDICFASNNNNLVRSPVFGVSPTSPIQSLSSYGTVTGAMATTAQQDTRIPLQDPNMIGYLRRIDSVKRLQETGRGGNKVTLKRRSDDSPHFASNSKFSRRRSDPCEDFTNMTLNQKASPVPLRAGAERPAPVQIGHSEQQFRSRKQKGNSPQALSRPRDNRWALAMKAVSQLNLPRPLRAQPLDFSGPQEKIVKFSEALRGLLLHLTEMRHYPELTNLPAHVENFMTSSQSLSELEHFVLFILSSHTFDGKVAEFVSRLKTTQVDPYDVVSFGLGWLTELLIEFVSGGKQVVSPSKSVHDRTGVSTSPSYGYSSKATSQQPVKSSRMMQQEEEDIINAWSSQQTMNEASKQQQQQSSSDFDPLPIRPTVSTHFGKGQKSSNQLASPTNFLSDAFEFCVTPVNANAMDELDWMMQPTPRNANSQQGGGGGGGSGNVKGLKLGQQPPSLNLTGLTPTNSFILSPNGNFLLSPKHSFSSLKHFNLEVPRRIDTDVGGLLSPRARTPLYADIDNFIAQTSQDGLFLSPPTPIAGLDNVRPAGDSGHAQEEQK